MTPPSHRIDHQTTAENLRQTLGRRPTGAEYRAARRQAAARRRAELPGPTRRQHATESALDTWQTIADLAAAHARRTGRAVPRRYAARAIQLTALAIATAVRYATKWRNP